MANINSSMSRNSGLVEGVLPEAPQNALPTQNKAKNSPSFAEHLEVPDPKAALAAAQTLTQGATRSSSQAARPAPEKKPSAAPADKRAAARPNDNPSLDMNPKKAPAQKSAPLDRPAKSAELSQTGPKDRAPSQARAEEASEQSRPAAKSAKPTKSQLTGMTKQKDPEAPQQPSKEGSVLVIQPNDIPAEGEDALDTVAFDAKQSEGEPWQKRLEDMLNFMGIPPQALQQELPALAILTGQLQAIEPESIPSALADSPLLNNVMASADPEAVIEQVKPLGLWLDEMGWSPDGLVIKDPEAFQDLMNTPVSLKDVMKTFEVDVDRVVKEASILQETLPMDGAAPYVERANRMQAESGKAGRKVKGAEGEKKSGMSPELLALLNSGAAASFEPKAPAPKATKEAKAIDSLGQSHSIDQLMASLTSQPSDGLPKVALTQENPFQAMELRSSETFAFSTETPADAPEALTAKNDSRDWLENIQASQIQADATPASAADKTRGFNPEVILDRMSESALAGVSDNQANDDQGDDFLSAKDNENPQLNQSQGTHKSQNTFDLGTVETQKAQPTHPVQKAVFEKAEMLVKDGGGAIRIDIGNKETGAIDLAVEVKDGKVDVKISAASAEARQLIAQELPRLRESLQNQNLNLSKVEVGLSGGSSWTSSDGRSSRQESSSSSQSEELVGVSGKGGRKTSRSYSRVSSTQEMQPGVTREGGGIKVRV